MVKSFSIREVIREYARALYGNPLEFAGWALMFLALALFSIPLSFVFGPFSSLLANIPFALFLALVLNKILKQRVFYNTFFDSLYVVLFIYLGVTVCLLMAGVLFVAVVCSLIPFAHISSFPPKFYPLFPIAAGIISGLCFFAGVLRLILSTGYMIETGSHASHALSKGRDRIESLSWKEYIKALLVLPLSVAILGIFFWIVLLSVATIFDIRVLIMFALVAFSFFYVHTGLIIGALYVVLRKEIE